MDQDRASEAATQVWAALERFMYASTLQDFNATMDDLLHTLDAAGKVLPPDEGREG